MRRRLILFLAVVTGLVLGQSTYAQGKADKVKVWEMFGGATYSVQGGPPRQLTIGTVLPVGTVVRTGPGAALDLRFDTGEVVRMTQNTILALDRSVVFRKAPYVEMTLAEGTILGRVKKLPTAGRFDVKVANGVVSARDGTFRISREGYVVLLEGQVLFAYVPKEGEPVLNTLKGPPAVYFSPLEGVRRAQPPLVKEVENQVHASLRRP